MNVNNDGRYVLGLDLGQAQDHSALAMLEWFPVPWPEPGDMPTLPRRRTRS
jgi:hypothetical protein